MDRAYLQSGGLSSHEQRKRIVFTVRKRKFEYFDHVMKGERYNLLQLIIQGKIAGKKSRGRRIMSWLRNLREWFVCSSIKLFRAVGPKIGIVMMIANLR